MTARMYLAEAVFASPAEERFVTTLREQLPDDAVMVCNPRLTKRGTDREAGVIVAGPATGSPSWR